MRVAFSWSEGLADRKDDKTALHFACPDALWIHSGIVKPVSLSLMSSFQCSTANASASYVVKYGSYSVVQELRFTLVVVVTSCLKHARSGPVLPSFICVDSALHPAALINRLMLLFSDVQYSQSYLIFILGLPWAFSFANCIKAVHYFHICSSYAK